MPDNLRHQQMPLSLFKGMCNLAHTPGIKEYLVRDPYTFAAYMCSIGQVLVDEGVLKASRQLRQLTADLAPYSTVERNSNKAEKLVGNRAEAMKVLTELKNQLGDRVTAVYSGQFIAWVGIYDEVFKKESNKAFSVLEEIVSKLSVEVFNMGLLYRTNVDDNLDAIENLLNLTSSERALIEAAMLFSIDLPSSLFLRYFEFSINSRSDVLEQIATSMLTNFIDTAAGEDDLSHAEQLKAAAQALNSEVSKPLAFGIARFDRHKKRFGRLSEFWINTFGYHDNEIGSSDGFFEQFVRRTSAKVSYSGALARITDTDAEIVADLLTKAHDAGADLKGCNILFYGPRKLDKRQVVTKLLDGKFENLYELVTRNASSEDYPSICWVAQKWLETSDEPCVLLVDRAEDVLTKGYRKHSFFWGMDGDDGGAKRGEDVQLDSDEELMTGSYVPTVWMTNSVTALSDDVIGRFLLHCEVKGGTRADRRDEVKKVVAELGLSDDLALQLSKYYELGSQQIRSAATLINVLEKKDPEASRLLIRTIESSQKALGRDKVEELRDSVTTYDLNLLNLSGRFPPKNIIEALKKRPSGTLCFYGLPGTGKTQLAEYMAMQLDLPILIKRASDILSMWLGENEQNIKKMFEEARSEGALLLLDEADSFLRDRALARVSWEVTMVNELLTQMERFPGIFICATNLFEQLDAAALRRFTFKLQFHPLTEDQRILMFKNETGVTVNQDDPMWLELMKIRFLTPGDFATVKRQANVLGMELTPEVWLEQLEIESKAKLIGVSSQRISADDLAREVTNKPKTLQ